MQVPTGNPVPRQDWLELGNEDAIEPALPIVDAHHHLWQKPFPYLLDNFLADLACGHNIRATIYAEAHAMHRMDGPEAMRPLGEVEFANGVAAMAASGDFGPVQINAAILGHANLALGKDVEPVLSAMVSASPDRFRGIRHFTARDAQVRLGSPEGMMATRAYRDGFAVLQDMGLVYEAWVYHPQLTELIDLMDAHPQSHVVLNHIGGRIGIGTYADTQDAVIAEWNQNMQRLARFPNVSVKIGGLGMALCGFGFHTQPLPPTSDQLADAWQERIRSVIDIFGPERCMFESNFPVDKASCSYANLWNAFKKVSAIYPADARERLFFGTAKSIYRMETVTLA